MRRPRAATRPLARHDHAFLVYDDPAHLREEITLFATAAADRGERVVFIHAFPTRDEAIRWLSATGFDPQPLLERTLFLVAYYVDAFEGGTGRIDVAHVARVVDGLVRDAEGEGRAVSLFVDASRAYLDAGRDDEWFDFENALGRRLHARVGLVCAYPATEVGSPARRAKVLHAHAYRFGEEPP